MTQIPAQVPPTKIDNWLWQSIVVTICCCLPLGIVGIVFAAQVNSTTENIGARRLHTILEKLLEDVSFDGPDLKKKNVKVDAVYVRKQLADIVKDQDLSRYIL